LLSILLSSNYACFILFTSSESVIHDLNSWLQIGG
jgi:hypothetical protein